MKKPYQSYTEHNKENIATEEVEIVEVPLTPFGEALQLVLAETRLRTGGEIMAERLKAFFDRQ